MTFGWLAAGKAICVGVARPQRVEALDHKFGIGQEIEPRSRTNPGYLDSFRAPLESIRRASSGSEVGRLPFVNSPEMLPEQDLQFLLIARKARA